MSNHTFLWHDYETFGIQAYRDRPAQFAAIRTDTELNEISHPILMYCQPASDFLPDPQSCLMTGITPQICLEHGIAEHKFAHQIKSIMSKPNTIGVGYNTMYFDDEITRFMFWRNLIDPYAREWQNNCGRWDLLNVVRTMYALRPQSMQWSFKENGIPSFKLAEITKANNLVHEIAHNALSDVRATIALARLIRNKQPRLFNFCLALHKKERVVIEIDLPQFNKPFLYISGIFPAKQGCVGLVWPLSIHPINKNHLIVWDLRYSPKRLLTMEPENVRACLLNSLPGKTINLPIKSVYLNKSPIVISNLKVLSSSRALELDIDINKTLRHADLAASINDMTEFWKIVFRYEKKIMIDVDEDLYSNFINKNDRHKLTQLKTLLPQKLTKTKFSFDDTRLEELVFRYRARNFFHSLTDQEIHRWEQYRINRLYDGKNNARTLNQVFENIKQLSKNVNDQDKKILIDLYNYATKIAPKKLL